MAQSYDRDYYDSHINEEIDIDIYQNRETFGLLDKDGFLIIDLSPGQHYTNQNDEKAMERYEFSTNDMRVTIDGYGNIVLPDGTIAKDEMSYDYLDHSVEFEIDRAVNFWNDAKDDPELVYDLNPNDFTFSITRLEADRNTNTDRTHEFYTTLRVEAYDKDRNILILNNGEDSQRYFAQTYGRTDEHSVEYEEALGVISKENAYNGGPKGKDILIPNKEVDISVLRNYEKIADFDRQINQSLLDPQNYTPVHLEPSRTDVFRVEGCVDVNEPYRLAYENDPYSSRFEPDYAVVLTSLSDNSTQVIHLDQYTPSSLEGIRQEVSAGEIAIEPYDYHAEITLPVDDKGHILIVPNVDEHGNFETFSTDFFEYSPAEGLVIYEEMFYEKDRDWDRDYDWGPSDGRDDPELP